MQDTGLVQATGQTTTMTGIIVNVNDQADVHDDGSVMVGSGSESFEVESACQDLDRTVWWTSDIRLLL